MGFIGHTYLENKQNGSNKYYLVVKFFYENDAANIVFHCRTIYGKIGPVHTANVGIEKIGPYQWAMENFSTSIIDKKIAKGYKKVDDLLPVNELMINNILGAFNCKPIVLSKEQKKHPILSADLTLQVKKNTPEKEEPKVEKQSRIFLI